MKKLLTLTAVTAALIGTASAAPQITAQSIIVNPVQSNVGVSVWTDRDPSGNSVPNYAPGERIRLYTRVTQNAYVYLFNVDPAGKVDMILPNRYASGQNYLRAGVTKVFPAANDGFTFDIAAPYGMNKVLALASTTPLNVDQIASFAGAQGGFASVNVQGQQQLAQALSIVVNPVPQNTWNSATAYYNVVSRGGYVPQVQPVRPAPPVYVRPTPVPVRPVTPPPPLQPWNGQNWNGQGNWSINVQIGNDSLAVVHERYANQLRSQGYRLVTIREYGNSIRSEWRNGNDTARLQVTQKGNGFDVRIDRRDR